MVLLEWNQICGSHQGSLSITDHLFTMYKILYT